MKQGVQVKVVELLPTVLGRMTDLEASARVLDRMTRHELLDIELKNSVIATRKRRNTYVVTYQNGGEEEADFIVASVGVKANTDFLKGADVEVDRIISVDDCQRTTVEDVYAAGDVCRSRHIVTGNGYIMPFGLLLQRREELQHATCPDRRGSMRAISP